MPLPLTADDLRHRAYLQEQARIEAARKRAEDKLRGSPYLRRRLEDNWQALKEYQTDARSRQRQDPEGNEVSD